MILYLSVFLAATLLSRLLTPLVRSTAIAHGLIAPPSCKRHLHTTALPRLGGVAICLAFVIALGAYVPIANLTHTAFPVRTLLGILLPASIIFFLGVYDDVRPLEAKSKIAVQSVGATALYLFGFGIHFPASFLGGNFIAQALGLSLTVFWVLLITNAFNLIDGLDGLAAGSALISALALFVTALLGHNDVVAILVIALAGATLGFLPSNFYPAKIFMGDSGSLLIGFLLSAVALIGPAKTTNMGDVAIPILIFGLPILDVTLAIARRLLRGQSPFRGDADHIHHKLLKLGLPQNQAVIALYGVTAAFGALSLIVMLHANWLAPVLAAVVIAVFFGVRRLRYVEFSLHPASWQGVSQSDQITAQQSPILRATELLRSSGDFRAICKILREALQPIGFDGICLKNLGSGYLPLSLVHPLEYDAEGRLTLMWSEWKSDDLRSRESRAELVISSYPTFRVSTADQDLQLELDALSGEFRTALSSAIGRAVNKVKPSRQATPKARAVAAGTESATGR
jgi:UDP-GlcNAc:undecaprenyl-phosphate GlcNAc-1-phosphate transferase